MEKGSEWSLDVQVRTTERIWFDKQHLDQVLWNIVRNAWRHGRKLAGSVRIVVSPSAQPGRLTLDVVDDGPGVPRETQAHLFDPFFTPQPHRPPLALSIPPHLSQCHAPPLAH